MRLFVACAPGLESLLYREVASLGISPTVVAGGVECAAALPDAYRLLLGSGLALRVVLRLATFRAVRFSQLQRSLRALPFERWLPRHAPVRIKATSKKSRLYHSGAAAQRLLEVLQEQVHVQPAQPATAGIRPPAIQLLLRLIDDNCTVSLDLVGSPQHERGYRLNPGRAPLREDLARALLLCAGYGGRGPLVDPCCGAGTLPLEAALLAHGYPPGGLRSFALQSLPFADRDIEQEVRTNLTLNNAKPHTVLIGNDRDATAVRAAIDNGSQLPFAASVRWQQGPLSAVQLPDPGDGERGLIVANPPYGQRLGRKTELGALYAALGRLRMNAPGGYRLALVTSEPNLAAAVGLPLQSVLLTDLGGTKVRFYIEHGTPTKSTG